jgi:hypothetical protein
MNFTSSRRHWFASLMLRVIGLVGTSAVSAINAQTATEQVFVGGSVTFIATADGNPAPTFQWQKEGSNISGATNALFTLANISLSDAGAYRVVAMNSEGSATSDPVIVAVNAVPSSPPPSEPNTAPTIQTQPLASQTVVKDATVTLSVVATGSPSPTYQWWKNGTAIPGATSALLTITPVTLQHAGSYTVTVSNAAGSVTSNAAQVMVNSAPVITTQPAVALTGTIGGSASFSVGASGVPAPTYEWRKDGQPISGATSPTLTLSALTAGQAGVYTVYVANAAGGIVSNSATLTIGTPDVGNPPPVSPPPAGVDTAPTISVQPVSAQTVVGGSQTSLSVVATGSPSPTFQWRKNGQAIAGATSSTLSFPSIKSSDSAAYSVLVSNRAGAIVSNNAVVTVNLIPAFTIQPVSQAVVPNAPVTLSVGVAGVPGPTLQWRKDGSPLPGATAAVLLLNSFSAADEGIYSVVATNAAGSVISHNAYVVIGASPRIMKQPSPQTVGTNSDATFTVVAVGTPLPTFQWKKNGVNIPGANTENLVLKSVAKTDEGTYTVEARNDVGWVLSSGAALNVNASSGQTTPNPGGGGSGTGTPDTAGAGDNTSSRIVNLSVRSQAGTGTNALIVGLVVSTGGSKSLLLRGIGPTLGNFGVQGFLADPTLSVFSGSALRAVNDDWNSNENASQIVGLGERLGAFNLPGATSDSALIATLEGGAYTVQVSGKQATSGIALVEVYDAAATSSSRLINLSVRTHVGVGDDAPNIGFVISGTTPKRVLLRAVGPALEAFGVTGVLADPKIEIFRGATRIHANDNWGGANELASTFAQVGAFAIQSPGSRDAALVVTLDPGAYTAVVSGVGGTTGVALVEVYDLP